MEQEQPPGDQAQSADLKKVVRELEFRTTVTTAMLGTLDLEQILYVILSGITSGDGLGFNRAFLFLTDASGRALRATMALGPASKEDAHAIWNGIQRDRLTLTTLLPRYESYREEAAQEGGLTRRIAAFALPLERLESLAVSPQSLIAGKRAPLAGVMARCLVERTPFASNGMALVHELGGASGEVMTFRNLAIVPLLVAGRLIGAILADNIYSKVPVESEHLRSMQAFGNLAALAIERARLHKKTVEMSELDGLTGVYNRRYYQQELERILALARRSSHTLSIVVFDLDFFKRANDEHGHLVGDQVLKEVARLLVESVRQSDKVARYGGEEFVVLLTDTKPDAAAQVAEKLRALVKETPLAKGKVQGLTLSAGVAGTRGRASAEELFARADRALYQAKSDGRDRVVIWSEALGSLEEEGA